MKIKRIASLMLALCILMGCFSGCGKETESTMGTELEMVATPSASTNAKGRYVEAAFPLPENQYALDMVMLTTGQLRVAVVDGSGNVVIHTTDTDRSGWAESWALSEEVSASGNIESVALSPDGAAFCSTIQDKGDGTYQPHFWSIDSAGECREIPIAYTELDPQTSYFVSKSDFTDDGRLIVDFYVSEIREVDPETGNLSKNINELESVVHGLGCAGSDVYILGWRTASVYQGEEAASLTGVLKEQIEGSLQATEGYNHKITFWENPDGYLFFTTHDGLYSYVPGGSITEELVSGARTSLGDPTFFPLTLTGVDDGSFYVLGDQDGESVLYHYVYDENAPTVADTQLHIYSLYEDEDLRQMIAQFQKANPEISVDLEIGLTGEDGVTEADAIRSLNAEILAGNGPDLLRLDGFSIDTYLEKGVLADLSGVLAEAGSLLEQVTHCYAADGKVCAVPTTFTLPAIYGAEHIVSQIHDLDSLVTAAQQARAENPDMDRIVNAMNPVMMADFYYDSCSAAWINSDGTLDGERLAEYYGAMKELYALDEAFRQENSERVERIAADLGTYYIPGDFTGLGGASYIFQDISYLTSGTLDGMANWSFVLAGEAEFLGDGYTTITFSGQVSNVFLPRRIMGILTTAEHRQAAEKFLTFMLSDEVQAKDLNTGFPVNKTTFDREIAEDQTSDVSFASSDEDGNVISYNAQWPDARRRQELKRWVDDLTTPALTNRTIRNMVMEQMSDCCNGIITPEQAAEAALQSLNLYLSE